MFDTPALAGTVAQITNEDIRLLKNNTEYIPTTLDNLCPRRVSPPPQIVGGAVRGGQWGGHPLTSGGHGPPWPPRGHAPGSKFCNEFNKAYSIVLRVYNVQ